MKDPIIWICLKLDAVICSFHSKYPRLSYFWESIKISAFVASIVCLLVYFLINERLKMVETMLLWSLFFLCFLLVFVHLYFKDKDVEKDQDEKDE